MASRRCNFFESLSYISLMTGLKLMILKPQKPALCPPLLVGHTPLSLSQLTHGQLCAHQRGTHFTQDPFS